MNLIARIQNGIDNLFMPHDTLTDQARDIVAHFDQDGDGVLSVQAIQGGSQVPPVGIFGIAQRGILEADASGNGNGFATVKEIRSLLLRYDVAAGAEGIGNKHIEGLELLRLLGDFSGPAGGAFRSTGAKQSADAVSQLA